jgi:hypothetical protein
VANNKLRWTPIVAVRGQGMLIDGRRIGLYSKKSMTVKSTGKTTYWGVMYLMLTTHEWNITQIMLRHDVIPPYDITFVSDNQPNDATVSRAFLAAYAEVEDEDVVFIGWGTTWGPHEIQYEDMQEQIIKMHDWITDNVTQNFGV